MASAKGWLIWLIYGIDGAFSKSGNFNRLAIAGAPAAQSKGIHERLRLAEQEFFLMKRIGYY